MKNLIAISFLLFFACSCDSNPNKKEAAENDIDAARTFIRAALDGAGITSISLDIVAPYLARGEMVRILSPWVTGRLVMYAALPSRKFIPQRSRVFLDYLVEHTREQNNEALRVCSVY